MSINVPVKGYGLYCKADTLLANTVLVLTTPVVYSMGKTSTERDKIRGLAGHSGYVEVEGVNIECFDDMDQHINRRSPSCLI